MDSSKLTTSQARIVAAVVRRELSYLGRLRKRMEATGFPPTDLVYQATSRAFNAMQELHVRLHYLTCKNGVGRPPRE